MHILLLTLINQHTPWGTPSSPITILSYLRSTGTPLIVVFLSRHGLYHEFVPHKVLSRANIAALRKLGVRCVAAFSAVGGLREEVKPRDCLVPDQVFDRTKGVSLRCWLKPLLSLENLECICIWWTSASCAVRLFALILPRHDASSDLHFLSLLSLRTHTIGQTVDLFRKGRCGPCWLL